MVSRLRVEIAPGQQFHHQVGDAAALLHVVEQADHVRVAHLVSGAVVGRATVSHSDSKQSRAEHVRVAHLA